MKFLLTAIVLFILSVASFGQNQIDTRLVGTWGLISFKYTLPDTTISGNSSTFNSIKVINNTHFAYIGKTTQGNVFKRAGGGRYKLTGEVLVEIHDYANLANMLGKSFQFKCVIDGDTWFHSGQINEIFVEEVWKKIN
jgi:hypothetical protein